jgi:peptide/nickel transport system substrate-binding protein
MRAAAKHFTPLALAVLTLLAASGRPHTQVQCSGDYCGTLVFADGGQPDILLPPVSVQGLSRDIYQQILLKLADIGPSLNTVGDRDFQPQLARRWAWESPTTLVFQLDPRARWQDGPPVTAADVAFTFAAYADSVVNAGSRPLLSGIVSVIARDSLTAVFKFRERYPEMFYDAVYHMYVLPRHLLDSVPRSRWATAAFGRAPIGDGPYRFVSWTPGQSVELGADSTFFLGRPHIRRLIWQFAANLPAAVTMVLAGQADATEFLGPPSMVRQAEQTPHLATYPYKGAAYGYLGFNLTRPLLQDRDVRRALVLALDREALCQSVLGDVGRVPPGPMPLSWSVWDSTIRTVPYDTGQANRLLAQRGWRDTDGDGIRDHDGQRLSIELLVPQSAIRRQFSRLIQAQLRVVGVDVKIVDVEDNLMQDRLARGDFDAAMQSYQADPTPTSSVPQHWSRDAAGNYGHYANPAFERALVAARRAPDAGAFARAWREAFDLLNDDAPAAWLYAVRPVAAVDRRVADVRIRPDAWWALIPTWRIPADRLNDRDRVER